MELVPWVVKEDVWPVFALAWARSPLTISSYIGELVEAVAHELGGAQPNENRPGILT